MSDFSFVQYWNLKIFEIDINFILRLTREEYENYLSNFSYYLLTEKPEESLQILSDLAKTACRAVLLEIWRPKFLKLFNTLAPESKFLNRSIFIDCVNRFYDEKCHIAGRYLL